MSVINLPLGAFAGSVGSSSGSSSKPFSSSSSVVSSSTVSLFMSTSSSSSHSPESGLKNHFPTNISPAVEPVREPSGFKVRSPRRTSSSCPRSSLMFPSSSKKISPISPRGPKICPLASTQAFPSSSLLTKLPSSSKRGILMGFPFTSKLTGILRSIHVPSVGLVVITIGKGRLSGPI